MPDREAAKRIFMAALDLDPAERPAFIAGQCHADAALQREVEALLAAHDGKPILDPATLPAQPANHASPKSKNIAGSARAGEEIGPYRLLERIGEGGFGEVWIAEQKTPVRRKVALKIIKAGMDTREVLARFEAERQALAVMDHPSVAKVFDAGATSGGRPYFVMEFVAGLPINAYCDSAKLRIKDRLHLFMSICHAVQHAHQKGIIHRDLKPGNIIVTLQDGKPVPKVIDFGIAKATIGRLTERTLYTETGRVIGTPEYMAPEQAGTSGLDVDTRADIYSLGVILYELLTGTLPLDGQTLRSAGFEAIGKMLKEFEPPKPSTRLSTMATEPVTRGKAEPDTIAKTHGTDLRTLQRELRGDLDWITLKALEKDRTRRYETASAFAADVDRHLTGEPVIAAPPSVGYRVKKFVRKHRGQVIAGGVIAAVLSLSTVGVTAAWLVTSRSLKKESIAREAEAAERERADAAAEQANRQTYATMIGSAQQAMAFKAWPEARAKLDAIDPEMRGWEWQFLRRKADAIWFEFPGANCAEFSPDGKLILTASDNTARIWDAATGQPVGEPMRHGDDLSSAAFSPDGKLVLTTSNDKSARLWDAATGQPVGEPMRHEGLVTSTEFSPDGRLILTIETDKTARLWDAATGKPVGEEMRHESYVASADFSPDGRLILTKDTNKSARLWDAATGKPVGEAIRHESHVTSAEFSPDGKLILTASEDGFARLWDAATGKLVAEMKHDHRLKSAPIFSRDGKLLLTTTGRTAWLWDAATGTPVGEAMKHDDYVYYTVYSPDGKLLLTTTGKTARLWDASTGRSTGEARFPLEDDEDDEWTLASFSPDGQLTMLRSLGYTSEYAYVHSTTHFSVPERRLNDQDVDLEVAAITDDPSYAPNVVARAGGANSKAMKVTSRDGSREVELTSDRSVKFHAKPTGPSLSAEGGDGQSARRAELASIRLDKQPTGLAFSPDGTRLVVWLEDQSALAWDTRGPEAQQVDRDARSAESDPAMKLVDSLWASEIPVDRLELAIRDDKSITPLRRLVAFKDLRARIAQVGSSVQQEFNKVIAECITPSRAMAWIMRSETLPNDTTPNARRIRQMVEKRIADWKPDAASLNNAAWQAVSNPDSPPERITAALEAATIALTMDPEDGTSLKNLGAAQYRAGQYEDGLKNLARAVTTLKEDGKPYPNTLSFIAMCQFRLGLSVDAQATLENLKAMLREQYGRIHGIVTGRRLDMEFSEVLDTDFEPSKRTGTGQFTLSEDGSMFSGEWRLNNRGGWVHWSGKRKAGNNPARFDGLWMTSCGEMWLYTKGEKVAGAFGIGPSVVESLELVLGKTNDANVVLEQWATSIIDFSSQYGSVDWAATQALGNPNTLDYGDIETSWAPIEPNSGTQFLILGFAQPVFASGVVVRETNCNGYVTQIDVVDTQDKLHTVWTGVDPSRKGIPVNFFVALSPTQRLVKGVKIYVDTDHDEGFEEIDAVSLIGSPEQRLVEPPLPTRPDASPPTQSPTTQPTSK